MIQCDLVELPELEDTALRKWLGNGSLQLLLKVAKGRQVKAETEALQAAITAKDPRNESYFDAANSHLREAQKYQTFTDLLILFSEQKTPHMVAKLS